MCFCVVFTIIYDIGKAIEKAINVIILSFSTFGIILIPLEATLIHSETTRNCHT